MSNCSNRFQITRKGCEVTEICEFWDADGNLVENCYTKDSTSFPDEIKTWELFLASLKECECEQAALIECGDADLNGNCLNFNTVADAYTYPLSAVASAAAQVSINVGGVNYTSTTGAMAPINGPEDWLAGIQEILTANPSLNLTVKYEDGDYIFCGQDIGLLNSLRLWRAIQALSHPGATPKKKGWLVVLCGFGALLEALYDIANRPHLIPVKTCAKVGEKWQQVIYYLDQSNPMPPQQVYETDGHTLIETEITEWDHTGCKCCVTCLAGDGGGDDGGGDDGEVSVRCSSRKLGAGLISESTGQVKWDTALVSNPALTAFNGTIRFVDSAGTSHTLNSVGDSVTGVASGAMQAVHYTGTFTTTFDGEEVTCSVDDKLISAITIVL